MSAGERVTDLVTNPVVGTAKGIAAGGTLGAVTGGTVGGVAGALVGGASGGSLSFLPALWTAGAAGMYGVGAAILGMFASHSLILGLAHAAVMSLIGGGVVLGGGILVGAAVGALGLGLLGGGLGGVTGAAGGGILGSIVGGIKGIYAFFAGRDTSVKENEQQLRVLREQAMTEQAMTAAYMRQNERAAAMSGMMNPDASDNNVAKLETQKQQAAAVPNPPMSV